MLVDLVANRDAPKENDTTPQDLSSVTDQITQDVAQQTLKNTPAPLPSQHASHITTDLVKYASPSIEQFQEIFTSATNPDSKLSKYQIGRILEALAINNNLNLEQLEKTLDLITNPDSKIDKYWRTPILLALATNDNLVAYLASRGKLSRQQIDEIFKFSTNLDSKLEKNQRCLILEALTISGNLNIKQLGKIFDLATNTYSKFDEHLRYVILHALATKSELTIEQCHKIIAFTSNSKLNAYWKIPILLLLAINPNSKLNEEHRGNLLFYLAKTEKINTEQYRTILNFAANPNSKLSALMIRNISEALDTNKQFSGKVIKELHQLNIITYPLPHLMRSHHFISDRINRSDEIQEGLLEGLNGMSFSYQISLFIDLLEKLTASNRSQAPNLKKLLPYMKKIKNIIEKLHLNINNDPAIQNLNELIKNLNPGEGIPIPLGTRGHALVYEINRNADDDSYSFAIINTGFGGEFANQEGDRVYCKKYSGLTSEEVCKIIKEAVDLNKGKGKYSTINYPEAGNEITRQEHSIQDFDKTVADLFSKKLKDTKTIPTQKRGTCTWSSLDRWFKRYCKQNHLEDLYNSFSTLTAEEALNTTNIILKNIKASRLNTEEQSVLERQAIIINREALRILRQPRPVHQHAQQIDHLYG